MRVAIGGKVEPRSAVVVAVAQPYIINMAVSEALARESALRPSNMDATMVGTIAPAMPSVAPPPDGHWHCRHSSSGALRGSSPDGHIPPLVRQRRWPPQPRILIGTYLSRPSGRLTIPIGT